MDDFTDSEATDSKAASDFLGVAGLIAAAVTLFAGGGLAVLASVVSFGCLIGSIAACLDANRESECERYCREEEQAADGQACEPAIGESPRIGHEAGPAKRWVQAIEAELKVGRRR